MTGTPATSPVLTIAKLSSTFTATVVVSCRATGDQASPFEGTIALAGGAAAGRRELSGGSSSLLYQLFMDPARSIPWGDGTGEGRTQAISGTASGAAPFRASLTVYGRLLARQSGALAGNYTDQVTAVLTY